MTRPTVVPIDTRSQRTHDTRRPQITVNARFIRLRSGRTVTPQIADLVVLAADEISDAGTSDLIGDLRRRFVLDRADLADILHSAGREARRQRDTLLVGLENAIAIGRDAAASTWSKEAA